MAARCPGSCSNGERGELARLAAHCAHGGAARAVPAPQGRLTAPGATVTSRQRLRAMCAAGTRAGPARLVCDHVLPSSASVWRF